MIPSPSPSAPPTRNLLIDQAVLLCQVEFGCDPLEASFAEQLPLWLMQQDFAQKFRASRQSGHTSCSRDEAMRRCDAALAKMLNSSALVPIPHQR